MPPSRSVIHLLVEEFELDGRHRHYYDEEHEAGARCLCHFKIGEGFLVNVEGCRLRRIERPAHCLEGHVVDLGEDAQELDAFHDRQEKGDRQQQRQRHLEQKQPAVRPVDARGFGNFLRDCLQPCEEYRGAVAEFRPHVDRHDRLQRLIRAVEKVLGRQADRHEQFVDDAQWRLEIHPAPDPGNRHDRGDVGEHVDQPEKRLALRDEIQEQGDRKADRDHRGGAEDRITHRIAEGLEKYGVGEYRHIVSQADESCLLAQKAPVGEAHHQHVEHGAQPHADEEDEREGKKGVCGNRPFCRQCHVPCPPFRSVTSRNCR
ncbi:hypothetical protein SDC9_31647 [bioreactor metagenome]|uniref:Uncharacterized protein n=1 Tax=bioreactor metagenome TaxID=1076179 RepID=A0A644V344_9ZZZZ